MIGIVIIILALAFAPVLKASVDDARGNSTDTHEGMGCDSIDNDWQRGYCFASDTFLPYFFFGLIGIGLAVIGAKIIS
jgi:hypothetical protein